MPLSVRFQRLCAFSVISLSVCFCASVSLAQPSDIQTARSFQASTVEIQFTSLQGRIALNRAYVGEITGFSYFSGDGAQRTGDLRREVIDLEGQPLILDLPGNIDIERVQVSGSLGDIILSKSVTPVAAPPNILWPIDGMIDIGSGRLVETIQGSEDVAGMAWPLADYIVTIGSSVIDVIALRGNEIAIAGDNINLMPQGATVSVQAPGGAVASGEVPAWGYKVYMQPGTDLNAWVPIFAQVTGLFPDEIVIMSFTAAAGQRIEPSTVTITGNEANEAKTVAYFLTQSEGDQTFNVGWRRTFAPPPPPEVSAPPQADDIVELPAEE